MAARTSTVHYFCPG